MKTALPVVLATRVSSDDGEAVDRAARQLGVSKAELVRRLVLPQARVIAQVASAERDQ